MKKAILSALSLLLLAGCSTAAQDEVDKIDTDVDTEADKAEVKLEGEAQYDSGETVKATVIKQGDEIADVILETLDQDGNAITQLEQMSDPKSQDTSIGTEWADQVAYLEDYIKANGVDNIKTDENGKAVDEELLKGVDVNIQPMLDAVNNALANEKDD
jgi:hypothetical protein